MFSNSPILLDTVSAVTATRGANDPRPGDVVWKGDERYIYVYNTGNSQISPGMAATVSAVTGYSVTVSTTTGADIVVGICKHSTLTTGTYGWLVQKGFTPVYPNVSCVTGDMLSIGDAGGFVLASNITGYLNANLVKAMESLATGTAGQGYVSL